MELDDFKFFRDYQLYNVDFSTGCIDTSRPHPYKKDSKIIRKDVGSLNQDGYVRLWCKHTLRMKHRLLYFLYYGELPIEIDHIDDNRSNNNIANLRSVTRKEQLMNIKKSKKGTKRLTKEQVIKVYELCSEGLNNTEIAKQLGFARTTIRDIRNLRSHKKLALSYFRTSTTIP